MIAETIAVTAATGKTGAATVRELRAKGFIVRALVRRRDARSVELEATGAQVVEADLRNRASMSAALKGTQRAYYCPPLVLETLETLDAFAHAAEANNLEAVAAMSQWLASPVHPAKMTRDMWAVEERMSVLGVPHVTILNPGFFADNYLCVSIGMAAQLGLYANFLGQSRNAPPSNDDMARVIAGVLEQPERFAGRRLRITGPELIGNNEIVAAISGVLGRSVRAIDAPDWLLNKVAAYRREPRYDMAVFRHYLIDHRQGAFEFGAPSDVVAAVTGKPAESFETTVRAYRARPDVQRTAGALATAVAQFALSPLVRGYDHDAFERDHGAVAPAGSLYAMENHRWRSEREGS